MTELQYMTPEDYHRMKTRTYRMLENGEPSWSGQAAYDEQAEEKCFFDEEPGSLVRYTLQYWSESRKEWVTVYKDAHLPTD
jgi:hypothetical protein